MVDQAENRNSSMKTSMENQICSILKDVIKEDPVTKNGEAETQDEYSDFLFGEEDSNSEGSEGETNPNTTLTNLTIIPFIKEDLEKCKTTITQNPFKEVDQNLLLNDEFTRKIPQFYNTQNFKSSSENFFNNFNQDENSPYASNNFKLSNGFFPQNAMNNFPRMKGSERSVKNFGSMKPITKNKFHLPTPQRSSYGNGRTQKQNINQLNKMQMNMQMQTTTPLGMPMPLRTFNFKNKNNFQKQNSTFYYQNQAEKYNQRFPGIQGNINTNHCGLNVIMNYSNISNINTIGNNINKEDPFANELESMLIQYNKFTMEVYLHLKGTFIQLIKNQQTSRICQYYLDQSPIDVIHLIFAEVSEQVASLLLDPYANYFCLKIFYFLNANDRMTYLKNIAPYVSNLSVNKIATYPVQCIIEHLSSEKEKEIIFNSISSSFMKLALDVYGTHVLEKVISYFDYEMSKPLSDFVIENFLFLAKNANGLCLVKKEIAIEYKKDNFERLKKELISNAIALIQNPFGNYALQTCIDLWDLEDLSDLVSCFLNQCGLLSIQKYSSNVIERCLEKSEKFLELFIDEISSNEDTMELLMKNNYGNYVIQTALKVSKPLSKGRIVNSIARSLVRLTDKKLINKWKSIISSLE